MFMQVIQGKIRDRDLIQRQIDKWRTDVKPGSIGYLGSTSGITDDGNFVVMARFESAAAAATNNERPEQGAWWDETAPGFDGEPTFTDCTEVDTMLGGGSNDAGFVQVMLGHSSDPAALRTAGEEMEGDMQAMRPDVLGGIVGWHGSGNFIQAMYFTSEDAARLGEKEMANDARAQEWGQYIDGEMTFIDLRDPDFD